jgi:hypothetical protein
MPSEFSLSEFFTDPRTLGYLLWAGLGAMTLTLLILMRTRWGQAKPISKCIALSVFAHVLLGGYAYGTRLILQVPLHAGGDADHAVELSFVETDEADGKSETSEKPWDAFMGDPVVSQLVSAERKSVVFSGDEIARDQLKEQPADRSQDQRVEALQQQLENRIVDQSDSAQLPEFPQEQAESSSASSTNFQITPQVATPTQISKSQSPIDLPEANEGPAVVAEKIELERPVGQFAPSQAAPDLTPRHEPAHTPQLNQAVDQLTQNLIDQQNPVPEFEPLVPDRASVPAKFASHPLDRQRANERAVNNLGVRRLADGQKIPELYALRVSENRKAIAIQNGGTVGSEQAVQQALRWLASSQSEDGRWDANKLEAGREDRVFGHNRNYAGIGADMGITGLALLAFLGAGHSHLEGDFQTQVHNGLEFLTGHQHADGSLSGDARLFASMYCHGIAALAISEAYALTGDQRLKPYVQRALDYSFAAQHSQTGGWRYRPGDDGDMSQFGWQVMAIKSGQLAGIDVPQSTYDGMHRFVAANTAGKFGGLGRYRANENVSRTMTAEAICCRLFLGEEINPDLAGEATDYLAGELPQEGRANYYYWYYSTLAHFQLGGERWERWNSALQEQLLKRQRKDGKYAGSYDPDSLWGGYGGRVFTTALATLSLEVYYRYLPLLDE